MPTTPHTYKTTILEQHIDTFGHMNNAAYLQLLEAARWDWMVSGGYGLAEIQKLQVGPTLLELNLRFRHEIRLRQSVSVQTKLTGLRHGIIGVHQDVLGENGKLHCEAELKIGFFDLRARRLVKPPAEWLKAVGAPI